MLVKIYDHEKMEKHPFSIKFVRILTVPLLNFIPAFLLKKLINKSSPYGSKVIEKPGSSHSLEAMYTKDDAKSQGFVKRIADAFWHNFVSQPKAVRNRLRIVEHILEENIAKLLDRNEEIQIYNLGGGSSRAMVRVLSRLLTNGKKVSVTTIDKDQKALELGKRLAQNYKVEHLFTWIEGDIRDLEKYVTPNSADLIEMVGLLDYFDNVSSVKLIKKINDSLKPFGIFLVANVHPNRESKFVSKVWPKMHYKTPAELNKILLNSGFKNEYSEMVMEPLKVHIVGIAKKI
jgi:SAM-dependent methyltransferase